jgi:hypothetical protein
VGWVLLTVVVLAVAVCSLGQALGQVLGPQRTRECTVESIIDVHNRRAADVQVLQTTECGGIQVPRVSDVEVVGADCA